MSDPVADRQVVNTFFVNVARLHFVERRSYRLDHEPFGPKDKYKDGVPLVLRTLSPDELKPALAKETADAFADASKAGTVVERENAYRAAVQQYAQDAMVRDRWIYAYVDAGDGKSFRYELHADGNGVISFLSAKDFHAIRGSDSDLDNDRDDEYLMRAEWASAGTTAFEQMLPLEAKGRRLRWFFFGSPMRLAGEFVGGLATDPELWAPEPGIDLLATSNLVIDSEDHAGPSGASSGSGVIVEVFDPIAVVRNLAVEYEARSHAHANYYLADKETPQAQRDRIKTRAGARAIANSIKLVKSMSQVSASKFDSAFRTTLGEKLRKRCFTDEEIERIDNLGIKTAKKMAWERFLEQDAGLQRFYLEDLCATATVLMLLLTSKPWGFMEDVAFSSSARCDRDGYRFLRVCCDATSLLGDTNNGARFLFELVDHIERFAHGPVVPGALTMRAFVMRDPNAPKPGKIAETAFKAGMAPINLWTKLNNLYNAKNAAYLKLLFERSGADVKQLGLSKMINSLVTPQRFLSLNAFTMARNLERVYGARVVTPRLGIFGTPGSPYAELYVDQHDKRYPLGKAVEFKFNVDEDFDDRIKELRGKVMHDPFETLDDERRLTKDNVGKVTGVLSLAFSARSFAIACEQAAPGLEVARSAFDLLKSIYSLPWVEGALKGRLEQRLLPGRTLKWAREAAERRLKGTNFALQAVTWSFAAHDLWKKSEKSSNEELTMSSLSFVAETAMLISTAMILISTTASPAGQALALIAGLVTVAQFVYSVQVPDDDEKLLDHCLFGEHFYEGEAPHYEARAWMGCPNHDIRYFNPDFTEKHSGDQFDAYRRQLVAFTNFVSSFTVKIEFSSDVVGVTIKPGWLARSGHFDVILHATWVRDTATGIGTFDRGDLWGDSFRLRFYPHAGSAPPLSAAQPHDEQLIELRQRGFVDVAGGPLDLRAVSFEDEIKLHFSPRSGAPVTVSGKLHSACVDGEPGLPLKRTGRLKARVLQQAQTRSGRMVLVVGIDIEPETAGDLKPVSASGEVDLFFGAEGQQSDPFSEIEVTEVEPGRHLLEIDLGKDGELTDGRLRSLRLAWKDGLGEWLHPEAIEGPPIDELDQPFEYKTAGRYEFVVPFTARFSHLGDRFRIEFVHEPIVVTSGTAPASGFEVQGVGLWYVRNEGAGAPQEQGDRDSYGVGEWIGLNRDPSLDEGDARGYSRLAFTSAADPLSVRIGDALTWSFGAGGKVGDAVINTVPRWEGPVKIRRTWSTSADARAAAEAKLVQSVRLQTYYAVEGFDDQSYYVPSMLKDDGPLGGEYLDVALDVSRARMDATLSDYLGGPPDAESGQAIDKCKC